MQLPTQLLRKNKKAYKNNFGHVLILAGSRRMLGAAALCGISAMRSGAGLVTIGIPKSLNNTLQKKISNVIMTWPLAETKEASLSLSAFKEIEKNYSKYSTIAIGPGLSSQKSTMQLIKKIISTSPIPSVVDADAINAIAGNSTILNKTQTDKILTPHPGEFSRITGIKTSIIEKNRKKYVEDFVKNHNCTLLLKGCYTLVAKKGKQTYINKTGNSGMATAGSGDVLTGMISAFSAQGLSDFDSAKLGAFLHGKSGDLAAKRISQASMTAEDILEFIPKTLK